LAYRAVDGLVFDLAQGLKTVSGVSNETVRRILGHADDLLAKLAGGENAQPELLRTRFAALVEFADAYRAQGDLSAAQAAAEQSNGIMQKLAASHPGIVGWQRDLSISWERLGEVRQAQGDLAGALQAYEEDMKITARLAASDPGNADWQRDLSISWNKLGEVRQAQDDLEGALAAYRPALQINQRLLDQTPNDAQRRLDLSNTLNRMAWLLATAEPENLRDPQTAMVMAKQAVELSEAKDPAIIDTLAMAHFSAGDINRAIEMAEQALALIPSPPPERVALHTEIQQHLAEFRTAAQRLEGDALADQ
jgi:tetratricopeptide (TPR) repeat protein